MSLGDGHLPDADDGTELSDAKPQVSRADARGALTKRSVSGFFWIFTGTGFQAVLKMLVLAVLARLLTPHDFGVVGAATVVISFLSIWTQLGVGPAIVQRAELSEAHIRSGQVISLVLGLVSGLVFYFSAPIIEALFRIEGLADVVRVLALVFPLKGISIVAEGLLQRHMRFKEMATVNAASYVLGYAPAAIVLAAYGWGAQALAFGILAQAILTRFTYRFLVRQTFSFSLNLPAARDLLSYGGGHTLARLGNFTALNADYLIVGRWLGAEALGIYTRAYQLIMQPTNLFGTVVDTVLFPALSSVQDDKEKMARVYMRLTAVVAMITLPTSVVLIVLADEIITTVLGPQWEGVVLPFQILISMLVFRTNYKLSDTLTLAIGAVYRRAWRQWVYAGAVVAGAGLGLSWGPAGVAVGVGFAILLNFWLMYQLCYSLIDISLKATLLTILRHGALSIALGGVALLGKFMLAALGMPKPVILVGDGAFLLALSLAVYRFFPVVFGEEGRWLHQTLVAKLRPNSGQ